MYKRADHRLINKKTPAIWTRNNVQPLKFQFRMETKALWNEYTTNKYRKLYASIYKINKTALWTIFMGLNLLNYMYIWWCWFDFSVCSLYWSLFSAKFAEKTPFRAINGSEKKCYDKIKQNDEIKSYLRAHTISLTFAVNLNVYSGQFHK